jgi:hypothetical protein
LNIVRPSHDAELVIDVFQREGMHRVPPVARKSSLLG